MERESDVPLRRARGRGRDPPQAPGRAPPLPTRERDCQRACLRTCVLALGQKKNEDYSLSTATATNLGPTVIPFPCGASKRRVDVHRVQRGKTMQLVAVPGRSAVSSATPTGSSKRTHGRGGTGAGRQRAAARAGHPLPPCPSSPTRLLSSFFQS